MTIQSKKDMYVENGKLYFRDKALDPKLYNPANFTHQAYENQLKVAKDKDYKFITFEQAAQKLKPEGKTILLNHAVPFSPTAALDIAEINKKYDAVGTFFFELDSPFYDLGNPDVQKQIQELRSRGQKIRLRVNVDRGNNDHGLSPIENACQKIKADLEKFRSLTGVKPTVFTMDTMGKEVGVDLPAEHIEETINAYHPSLTSEEYKILTNSNGMHLYGYDLYDLMEENVDSIQYGAMPEWFSQGPLLPMQRLLSLPEVQNNEEDMEKFLDKVHRGSRVYVGDGWDPHIDAHLQRMISEVGPGFEGPTHG